MDRGDGTRDRSQRRNRRTERAALAHRQVHACRVRRKGYRPDGPRSRQNLRRLDQRAPAFRSLAAASDHAHRLQSPARTEGVTMADTIEKISIIVSKGSLEGIYPALIMANGARD